MTLDPNKIFLKSMDLESKHFRFIDLKSKSKYPNAIIEYFKKFYVNNLILFMDAFCMDGGKSIT